MKRNAVRMGDFENAGAAFSPGRTIASRNGRAMQAPMPFSILLRDICHFLFITMLFFALVSYLHFVIP
jgi:hypothetical protein